MQWLKWLWLLALCVGAERSLFSHLADPMQYDVEHTYLPAARALLRDGWAFFLQPQSYYVGPLGYAWPALWGADSQWIRRVNALLFAACLLMVWRIAKLMGGTRAAVVATALMLLQKEFRKYFPTEMTEPVFITGLFLLTWALAEIHLARRLSRAWVAIGAAGLSVTLLSRPVLQLMAPMAAVLFAAAWWRMKTSPPTAPLNTAVAQRKTRDSMLLLAFGMLPSIALLIKNGMVFGLWGLSTGAGGGMFLGLHPLSQGTEPDYYGLNFENGLAGFLHPAGGFAHLDIQTDRIQRHIAISSFFNLPIADQLAFLTRKLRWWLIFHPHEARFQIRFWRLFALLSMMAGTLFTLAFALRSFAQRGKSPRDDVTPPYPSASQQWFALGLLIAWLTLLLQLLPVLVNKRYSLGFLDPWLVLLAGYGFAVATRRIRPMWAVGAMHTLVGVRLTGRSAALRVIAVLSAPALLFAAAWGTQRSLVLDRAQIDPPPLSGPTRVLARIGPQAPRVQPHIHEENGQWVTLAAPAALVMPIHFDATPTLTTPPLPANDFWTIRMAVQPPAAGGDCKKAEVGLTRAAGGATLQGPWIRLKADGQMHTYTVHGTADLRPVGEGDLRIALHCPVGTRITWQAAELHRSTYFETWARRLYPAAFTDASCVLCNPHEHSSCHPAGVMCLWHRIGPTAVQAGGH